MESGMAGSFLLCSLIGSTFNLQIPLGAWLLKSCLPRSNLFAIHGFDTGLPQYMFLVKRKIQEKFAAVHGD